MAAYLIVRVAISEPEAYHRYTKVTPGIIAAHGGRMIIRGGAMETVEGAEETRRIVVIEFPSMAAARAFYDSEDYQKAKAIRAGAGEAQFTIVDGYPAAEWEKALAADGRQIENR